jgi:hypothetical protein
MRHRLLIALCCCCFLLAVRKWGTVHQDDRSPTEESLGGSVDRPTERRQWVGVECDPNSWFETTSCALWRTGAWVPVPEATEEAVGRLISTGVKRAARGRPVLVSGDSLARQVFMNLVAAVRSNAPTTEAFERERLVEHYFHRDAVYALAANQTDRLTVNTNPSDPIDRACSQQVADEVTVCYLWDPNGARAAEQHANVGLWIHVLDYQWFFLPWDFEDQVIDKARDYELYGGGFALAPRTSLVIFAPPEMEIGNPYLKIRNHALHVRQNAVNTIVAALRRTGSHVKMMEISQYSPNPAARCDGMHFACNFQPEYPHTPTHIKRNCSPCNDPTNARLVLAALEFAAGGENA